MPPSPQPFMIAIPEDQIHHLHHKLALATFPDELEDVGRKYGMRLADICCLIARWKEGYDWRMHKAALNAQLPQFTLDIPVEGFRVLNTHFVHQMSKVGGCDTIVVHSWMLLGYGFLQVPTKQGFASAQYAEVGHKLMLAFGYGAYGNFSHKWETEEHTCNQITDTIAVKYGGTHAKAWHTNLLIGAKPPISCPLLWLKDHLLPLTVFEKAGLENSKVFDATGRRYFLEQVMQPQTLGYSLADSPIGMNEYPWEDDDGKWTVVIGNLKFMSKHDGGGHFVVHEKPEELVGDLRRFFGRGGAAGGVVPGKSGYEGYSHEQATQPQTIRWTQAIGNLTFMSEHPYGGHFMVQEKLEE
ncbi:epoxide hydrolase [Armillaria luteobubalina]|uniref:Epoxide hydrolase n=1 Tax=Armillaria luteobubalina TaxID=153913 RepID=A0AA39UUG3_9AGAR|nr:epoxide hydrolase [Armillaria luteobubalina]